MFAFPQKLSTDINLTLFNNEKQIIVYNSDLVVIHEVRTFLFFLPREEESGLIKNKKKIDKEGSEGSQFWPKMVDANFRDPFVLSLWGSMLRNLLSGNATFKKFCHFIKITFILFHCCLGNCVGRRESKQYRFYWKINFVEIKCGDEIFPWNF